MLGQKGQYLLYREQVKMRKLKKVNFEVRTKRLRINRIQIFILVTLDST